LKKQKKEYYNKVKDTIEYKNKCSDYNKKNKEKKKEYDKVYRDLNKEKIKKKHSKRYYDNREVINLKRRDEYKNKKVKVKCECGSIVGSYSLNAHKKTKKHTLFLKSM